MNIPFTKMQALGNDFVVLDFISNPMSLNAAQASQIADRHFGVGCDQILIVENSDRPEIDFKYRIMNADGSEVGQCGNGARCFARFVLDNHLTEKTEIAVETITGEMLLQVQNNGQIQVNMGIPNFIAENIPFLADESSLSYQLELAQQTIEITPVSIGNPHAVIVVDDVAKAPVASVGPEIESHSRFPERVNVGFMQIINKHEIKLRVFERGAGETLACGSGACAAVAAGQALGLLAEHVKVTLTGGELEVAWAGNSQPILMTGPAETVFSGEINLKEFTA